MRYFIILLAFVNLSGCAVVGAIYDNADDCQRKGRQNYQYPSFCGASGSGGYVTRGYYNNRPVYRTQYNRY